MQEADSEVWVDAGGTGCGLACYVVYKGCRSTRVDSCDQGGERRTWGWERERDLRQGSKWQNTNQTWCVWGGKWFYFGLIYCPWICLQIRECGAHGGQRRVLDPLELLQVVMKCLVWALVTELGFLGRTECALNCWAISLAPHSHQRIFIWRVEGEVGATGVPGTQTIASFFLPLSLLLLSF